VHFEEESLVEEEETDKEADKLKQLLQKSVEELELSVRSGNCLRAANIRTLGDLVQKSEPEMLKYRNFGRKSLKEIQDILEQMGLHFGMDVGKYRLDEINRGREAGIGEPHATQQRSQKAQQNARAQEGALAQSGDRAVSEREDRDERRQGQGDAESGERMITFAKRETSTRAG